MARGLLWANLYHYEARFSNFLFLSGVPKYWGIVQLLGQATQLKIGPFSTAGMPRWKLVVSLLYTCYSESGVTCPLIVYSWVGRQQFSFTFLCRDEPSSATKLQAVSIVIIYSEMLIFI